MKRVVLSLPVLALILQVDQLFPFPKPALPRHEAGDLLEVYRALPARDIGKFERPADPLNMIFLGTEEQVRGAIAGAGWSAIPDDISDCVRLGLKELWLGRTVASFPPMSDFRVMGRVQDMNWARVIRPLETRHHFRLWKTGVFDGRGRQVWWGSGNYDLSIRLRDLSHRPDPDMNMERDYVGKTLVGSERVERMELLALPQIPAAGVNAHGYPFKTDGRALLVELR